MPRIWRMAAYMKGYIKGASTEPELKMMIAPRTSSKMISGTSHHFFSWRRNRKNSLTSCHISGTTLFDPVKVCACAKVDRVAERSGRGHETIGQSILAHLGELPARFDDGGLSLFAADIDIAVGVNWGGGIVAPDAFAPDFSAGCGFEARRDPAVVNAVQKIINEQQRRLFWNIPLGLPDHLKLLVRLC